MSIQNVIAGEGRVAGESEKIPDWLRRLDRESRERQRRIVVHIDDGVDPDPSKRKRPPRRD